MTKYPQLPEKMKSKFKISDTGCWQWLGGLGRYGYGEYFFQSKPRIRKMAHRAVWEILNGDVQKGFELDHLCRNRGCVNPNHLEVVTRSVNIKRGLMGDLRQIKTHCLHGHLYTKENTYIVTKPNGRTKRSCIICRHLASKRSNERISNAALAAKMDRCD